MSEPLHLVRAEIDAQRLYAFAQRTRLTSRELDEGYAVHALFAALFDNGAEPDSRVAPKPFSILERSTRNVLVMGYSRFDHRGLIERASAFGDPVAHGVCKLEELASKPLPTAFAAGTRLGFSVRVCPVKRVAKRGNQRSDRAEVDVFLAKAWEIGDPSVQLDREEIYRAWLHDELSANGAAVPLDVTMTSFRLGPVHRRTQGSDRRGHRVMHPDVGFNGVLEVGDPAAFTARLARGLGRHRAFGFGMLLLKPAPGR